MLVGAGDVPLQQKQNRQNSKQNNIREKVGHQRCGWSIFKDRETITKQHKCHYKLIKNPIRTRGAGIGVAKQQEKKEWKQNTTTAQSHYLWTYTYTIKILRKNYVKMRIIIDRLHSRPQSRLTPANIMYRLNTRKYQTQWNTIENNERKNSMAHIHNRNFLIYIFNSSAQTFQWPLKKVVTKRSINKQ